MTPKMPPRPPREIEDDHYHPERLLRAVAQIIAFALIAGMVVWAVWG